jgi:hypothetical protein
MQAKEKVLVEGYLESLPCQFLQLYGPLHRFILYFPIDFAGDETALAHTGLSWSIL